MYSVNTATMKVHSLLLLALHTSRLYSFVLKNHVHSFSTTRVIHAEKTVENETDVTYTLPKFFPQEIEYGCYPSSLQKIHVKTILSNEETQKVLSIAKSYAEATGSWDQPDSNRHATYATCDFPVEDCEEMTEYLESISFQERIWRELGERYGVEWEDMTYLDFFCAHYRARDESRTNSMDRLMPHRDGSLLSFTLTLSDPDDFEGGGTFFEALRDVEPDGGNLRKGGVIRPLRAGDAVLQCGKLLHGADVVTAGERTVLVGFIDVSEFRQRPRALSEACRDWGRMDVATRRYTHQLSKTDNGQKNGWILNHPWLLKKSLQQSTSCPNFIQGFCPAFASVQRRADPEFQRRRRLETEDILLRTILLEEAIPTFSILGGDVSIL